MENGKLKFNSIEETKEFLQDTLNNSEANGFLVCNGKKIPLKVFVEKIGIDNTAKILYESQGDISAYEYDKESFMNLVKRYINDPDSISAEEKDFADEILQMYIKQSCNVEQISTILLRELYNTREGIYSTISGIFTFLLTFMEMILGYSIEGYEDGVIRKDVMERLSDSIRENGIKNIQPEILPLGLLQCFGESIITPYFEGIKFDYESFAEQYNLDIGNSNEYHKSSNKQEQEDSGSDSISSLSREIEKIVTGNSSTEVGKSSARERMKRRN